MRKPPRPPPRPPYPYPHKPPPSPTSKYLTRLLSRTTTLRRAILQFSTQLLHAYPQLPTRVLRLHYNRFEAVLAALQREVGGVGTWVEEWSKAGGGGGKNGDGGWGLWMHLLEAQLEECEALLDEAVEAAGAG